MRTLAALFASSLLFAGCAVQNESATDEGDVEQSDDALATSKLYGTWDAVSGPIDSITFDSSHAETLGGFLKGRNFSATVDNGVRCITTPCAASDDVGGVYKLSHGTRLTLAAYDKPTATFAKYLGDYSVKLSNTGVLTLKKSDGTVVAQLKKHTAAKCEVPSETATGPTATITAGPMGVATTSKASFSFTSTASDATFQCQVDGGAWTTCSSPATYTVASGPHTFQVRAVSMTSCSIGAPTARSWTVDTIAPETTITSGPIGVMTTAAASFTFTSTEAGASFQCAIDGAAWVGCTSPKSYAGLASGDHTFSVRAVDAVGNADATPATRTWTVDTVGPETIIVSSPAGTTTSTSATFVISSPEPGAAFQCSLDTQPWASCSTTASYTAIAAGTHQFRARAVDAFGNVDASPATVTWTIAF